MAINISELFSNLGKVFYTHEVSEDHTRAIPTQFTALETAYEASDDLDLITTVPQIKNNYQVNSETLANYLSPIAQATIIKVVNEDSPQPNLAFLTAYDELVKQMNTAGSTVLKNNVSGTVVANTNNGDGVFSISIKNYAGVYNEDIFAEDAVFTCITDSQSGTVAGNETFTISGEYEISNPTSVLYPNQGSGVSTNLSCISANGSNAYGNLLTNSNFLLTTNWSTDSSVTIDNTAGAYYGINSMRAINNGTGSQLFGTGTGTSGLLQPSTQYSVAYWAKGIGTITVKLDDGTTVMNDAAGIANSNAFVCSDTGSWVSHTAAFRTPAILPAITRFAVSFSSVTTQVAVDFISLGTTTELYARGPSFAIHSGVTNFYKGDGAVATTTNNYAGKYQTYFNRFFNLRDNYRQLPSADSGSETIANALIG
jgi:hypothetical protein